MEPDLHAYGTLLSSVALAIALADVFARSATGIKTVIAGIDRLILKDKDRENHSDSAAFLLGYILGLPCFCYQPDVKEALGMFLESRGSMEVYRQPILKNILKSKDMKDGNSMSNSNGNSAGFIQDLFSTFSTSFKIPSKQKDSSISSNATVGSSSVGSSIIVPPMSTPDIDEENDLFGVGRVLVWLMAPVAAEVLKYGKRIG